ncbi:hypothetical protein HNP82_002640 [Catenibacillus scindens]|uniref:SnoaL-like domain-containing protein n=1 Tax=Catenibacillus scindens TaxID=673271 RepID=A0A7W8M618_9FIRM|nr:hypothetical protein [Catenibacillus scindens]MBB5265494.1 hypothetical protein [Catenibacillus scindens]
MNTDMIACMQNVMGCFVQYIYLGKYSKCAMLFSQDKDVCLNLPEKQLYVKGFSSVSKVFCEMEERYQMGEMPAEIFILNSKAYRTYKNRGKGMWEAFTFKYSCHMNNKDLEAVPSFYRFDCDFIVEDHQVKILRMDGYMAVNWLPWKCRLEKNIVERQCLMWDDLKEINGEEFVQIEQLVSRKAHTWESREGDALTFVPIPVAPVIQVYESDQAKGQWLVMGFDISRDMEGSGFVAVRQIGLMKVSFIKKNNEWLIRDEEFLAREVFEPRKVREASPRQHWRPPVPRLPGSPSAEDIFAIESLMPEWTDRLKVGRLQEFVPKYMSQAKDELFFWLGEDDQRIKTGYDQVLKDCLRMDSNYKNNRYKTPIIHSAMAPLIEISEDGTLAYAQWLDQCCTDTSQMTGDYTFPFPAMMNLCKYQHVFRKENGTWKLLKFTWNVWASLGNIYTDPRAWKGWVSYEDVPWPMPFEEYKKISCNLSQSMVK